MLVCLDVHYGDTAVVAALVGFRAWTDGTSALELVDRHDPDPAPYTPGAFFERELPYLAALIVRVADPIDAIVIDGYVWLGPDRKGLGVHVHERVAVPVIGVAKTSFAGAIATPVLRGASAQPLLVTSIGIDEAIAAAHIRDMHGPFRIPTLIKRADSLARGHATPT
jgi:deoxyribonuclease V